MTKKQNSNNNRSRSKTVINVETDQNDSNNEIIHSPAQNTRSRINKKNINHEISGLKTSKQNKRVRFFLRWFYFIKMLN